MIQILPLPPAWLWYDPFAGATTTIWLLLNTTTRKSFRGVNPTNPWNGPWHRWWKPIFTTSPERIFMDRWIFRGRSNTKTAAKRDRKITSGENLPSVAKEYSTRINTHKSSHWFPEPVPNQPFIYEKNQDKNQVAITTYISVFFRMTIIREN